MTEHTIKEVLRTCPYCKRRGWRDDRVAVWYNRNVETDTPTRWTRCENCYAMWREIYSYPDHRYIHSDHWKPGA